MSKLFTVVEIYREDSCGIAVWRTEKKRERLDVGGEDLGDSPESFSHAFARTLLVARNDPPTHSCWRSVVDDNGNPIFRNNICLEDRRLASCDAAGVCIYICICVCVYVCMRCTRCSIPIVTSFILFFNLFCDIKC